jgi:hypothetical protein
MTFDQPYRRKRLRGIHVDGTGVLDAYIAKDFANGGNTGQAQDVFAYSGATSTFGGTGTFGGTASSVTRPRSEQTAADARGGTGVQLQGAVRERAAAGARRV